MKKKQSKKFACTWTFFNNDGKYNGVWKTAEA